VVLNRPLDVCTAEAIAEVRATVKGKPAPYFVEVLVAPGFDDDALNMLHAQTGWASRIRILKAGPLNRSLVDETAKDGRRIVGGVLIQDRDLLGFDPQSNKVVTALQPTEQQMQDLRFAWLCCKHVKSSAVVLARDQGTVGVGPGQISRADAAAVALRKAGDRAQGAVMAADAFIPSPDLVEQAARAGVKAIIQPGGTPDDAAVFEAANRLGLAMVITGTRHLRH
jgi:phosphoribosylaminoimidazolecarboxamide formyltransferase/IMP cyclohydrolase